MSIDQIKHLISKYDSNREYYLSSTYNETQLRIDFLDPFFEALGWDIKNTKNKVTYEREVVVEESLKHENSLNSKKPDYTFRLFGERKFFVEAKKPSVKIEQSDDPAKQVRRYGFTAKLKISVLSNFEYLAIYDCSQKVEETDGFSKSRVKLYHYSEYANLFEEIKKEIGYDSVYSGEFDDKWKIIENQLKLFSVDNLFLSQINDWRMLLGSEIYSHNSQFDEITLNDIVQRYINSIIFLRVCEDRNLEEYKTLFNIAENDDYRKLILKFRESDRKYNSGLFNHPLVEDIISTNYSAFWKIIKQLYYPESTYSFSVFSSDILGNIYEIFLGEQLRIINGEIRLEKKPENIDRDIITTPNFIVKNIIFQTVLEYCKGKTAQEILGFTFADIACGSGVFLLETYQLLSDILVDYYLTNNKDILIQTGANSFKLPFEIKKNIILKCLYGVDKDYNAVEACKFGLLLKLVEDEDNSHLPTHALPDLNNVINFGNSLISSESTDSSNFTEINPFNFGEKRFDVIIGNPPYMTTDEMKTFTIKEFPIYKDTYKSAYKQFDKYFLFIERSLNLLKEGGLLGYIVPNKFTKVGGGVKLRKLIRERQFLNKYVSFGANQLFDDKSTYTCILVLSNKENSLLKYAEIKDVKNWKLRDLSKSESFDQMAFEDLNDEVWIFIPEVLKNAYTKINSISIPLGELVGDDNIFNGIQTSANDVYIHNSLREDGEYIYFNKNGIDYKVEKELTRPYYRTSSGEDNLNTYRPFKPNSFVIYPYIKNADGAIKFVDIDTLGTKYPFTLKYFRDYQSILQRPGRDIKPIPENDNEWYRYGRHQSLENCDVSQKIIVGVLSQGNKYAIDNYRTLISSGGTAGYCMITIPTEVKYSIYYIQAILNSKYCEWYSSLIGEVFRGGYIARGTKVLKKLPIRRIDFRNPNEKNLHDKIADTQKELIEIKTVIDQSIGDERKIEIYYRQFGIKKQTLDGYLTELFGLKEEDSLIPLITENNETNT